MLGQQLVRRMSEFPEYDVLATARDAAPRFAEHAGGYAPLDITDPAAVRRIFDDFAPTVVVNGAAMTNVDACETQREDCWRVNVAAVETLAKECRRTGARLVQISTDFIFDGESGPYDEKARPNPLSYYGRSKLASENAAREAGIGKWVVARTVLVYGAPENAPRSNIALWALDRLQRGEPLRIVTDHIRSPTYAPDLADGVERIVRFEKSGTYHLSGREVLSVHEFVREVADVFGFDPDLVDATDSTQFTQAAPRPLETGLIILKAETELGYHPLPLRDALTDLRRRLGLAVAR